MDSITKKNIMVHVSCRLNNRYCGLCCYDTQMILLPEDIDDIVKLGYKPEYFIDLSTDIPRLKNINGHCVFLDPTNNKCMIYGSRPLGCRLYPLIYDLDRDEILVDNLCPRAYEVDSIELNEYKWVFQYIIRRIKDYRMDKKSLRSSSR
ncbi:MAG: zinc/iron-chelating domain-containing protein [Desulfurococcales archaeon ex4484_58]|nr:MAG: zinc/iron-chelating domain-containing protein [Desulfurococcales archaeon ex4484_58]